MKNTMLTVGLIVMLVLGIAAGIAMAKPITDRMGFPSGYVGGELLPNGDVRGGHPSEEVMERDNIRNGVCTNNREALERMGAHLNCTEVT